MIQGFVNPWRISNIKIKHVQITIDPWQTQKKLDKYGQSTGMVNCIISII